MTRYGRIPPPTPQQRTKLDEMHARYTDLVAENALLQGVLRAGLEMVGLPLPTLQQVEQLFDLQDKQTQMSSENKILEDLLFDMLSRSMEEVTSSTDQLLDDNSKMVTKLHASLGPQAHCFGQLFSEVYQMSSKVSRLRAEEEEFLQGKGWSDSNADDGLQSGNGLGLTRTEMTMLEEAMRELDGDHEGLPSAMVAMLAAGHQQLRAPMGNPGTQQAGVDHQWLHDEFAAQAQRQEDEDEEALAEVAGESNKRSRRRHNVNGSTRARRRRLRARAEAADAAAADSDSA